MKKNILLTGEHSSGKTAVIKNLIGNLNVPANGFYIEEERESNLRVGFLITTLDGKQCRLAHRDIDSVCNLRRYGVSIENIECVAVPSIAPVDKNVIILDGIGKMQCFSKVFREAVIKALDSSNIVIGTISPGEDNFIINIMKRKDVEIHEVTWNNRRLLPDFILKKITELLTINEKKFPTGKKQSKNTVHFATKAGYECIHL